MSKRKSPKAKDIKSVLGVTRPYATDEALASLDDSRFLLPTNEFVVRS